MTLELLKLKTSESRVNRTHNINVNQERLYSSVIRNIITDEDDLFRVKI